MRKKCKFSYERLFFLLRETFVTRERAFTRDTSHLLSAFTRVKMEGKCSRHDQTKLSLSPLTVAAGVPNAAVGRRGQAPKGAAALHLRHPGACPALVRSAGARGSGPAVVLTHLVFLHLHALFAAHPRRARRGGRQR